MRVAALDGKHYIDLSNDKWQVVEVSVDGYQVLDKSPVRFVRSTHMQPLPVPEPGGDIDNLWALLMCQSRAGYWFWLG